MTTIPKQMKAAAINEFGGIEKISIQEVEVPSIDSNEVLIKVDYAGVGSWEPFEREGGYAEMQDVTPNFPYILGSEGAGTIVAVGDDVKRFVVGDSVYAVGFLNQKGGFCAEYAAIGADLISHVPKQVTLEQAAGMGGVGMTALRGLGDTLKLQANESIVIFGASGAMGHLAVQLAKRMGAKVFAVAAGKEGVKLTEDIGADMAIDGYSEDIVSTAKTFAPDGIDTAFLTAGGEKAQTSLQTLKDGGRAIYPTGVFPEPEKISSIEITNFNGEPDRDLVERFNALIGNDPFTVHIAHVYKLEEIKEAHTALTDSHLGKLVLRIS